MTQGGFKTVFSANLRKRRLDGTIVYHDNRFINFILKKFYERGR